MPTLTIEDVLSCPTLPSLPAVAVELLRRTRDPNSTVQDIAAIIQNDQALAAKVLKTVNSSFYALSTPCGSLQRAIALLGLETIKSLALGFSLIETTKSTCQNGFDLNAHWRRSIHGAVAAREFAQVMKGVDQDEAFTAGLFQDVGVLALYMACKDDYAELLARAEPGLHGICDLEVERFGLDHASISQGLLEKWNLPPQIALAVGTHHDDLSRLDGLGRAVSMGRLTAEALAINANASAVDTCVAALKSEITQESPDEYLERILDSAQALASVFEVELGDPPNVGELLAEAQEVAIELQIKAHQRAESLTRRAETDGLTGVANRARFDQLLEAEANRHRRAQDDLAIIFVDADHFKSVNDVHGHGAGDAVLVELARRLSSVVADKGHVCRYGGEEFAIILPQADVTAAMILAESIRAVVEATPFDITSNDGSETTIAVTISAGVAAAAGTSAPIDTGSLLKEADAAVYQSKRNGRNCVSKSTPERASDAELRVMIVDDDALAATLVKTLISRTLKAEFDVLSRGDMAAEQILAAAEGKSAAPGIVILDVNLPGTSGIDLLRLVKQHERLQNTRVFVITASEDSRYRDEAIALGATGFMTKASVCNQLPQWVASIAASVAA